MGKDNNVLKTLDSLSVSRRSFMKGLAAIGALGAVAGCSNSDDNSVIQTGGGSSGEGNLSGSDFANPKIYYAGCVHNCGTGVRCVSKIHVVNGRIVRVTSDESDTAYDGSYRNKKQYNDSRALTCPKGRSYKYRVHHPGRLQYVLKQTKARGDVTGFVRILPETAMKEIAQKYRSIYTKYGAGAIYNTYGTSASYGGTFSNPSAARSALTSVGSTRSAFSDYSYHQYNYANPLTGHPDIGGPYSKSNNIGANFHAMAGGAIKNLVSWGSNVLSTNNSVSYGYIRAVEYLKNNGGKAYFIGPEFTDTGVTCHSEWVKLRNYTDAALIMAMLYHMLTNTFDLTTGDVKSSPMLDIDYLDECVYGFFASPAYWIMYNDNVYNSDISIASEYIVSPQDNKVYMSQEDINIPVGEWDNGTQCWVKVVDTSNPRNIEEDGYTEDPDPNHKVNDVVKEKPQDAFITYGYYSERMQYTNGKGEYAYFKPGAIKINAVPAGRSLADYILGSEAAKLSNITYANTGSTYTAKQFGNNKRFGSGCTYPIGKKTSGTSEYQYKNDFNTPKTPEWASKITGVPVEKIIELAELYANPDNNVLTEWCGGFQKQENGVMNVFALSALLVVCKTFGKWGGGMYGPWASTIINPNGKDISGTAGDTEFLDLSSIGSGSAGISVNVKQSTASVSCTQWFNGIKFAFKEDLQSGGYTDANIPDWDFSGNDRYSNDDAGVKAGVVWKRYTADDPNGTYKKGDIMTYQDNGIEYYDFEGRDTSGSGNHNPVFAGTRMIISAAGGIPLNQHSNTNDTAAMYKALPISGDSTNADTFCLVTFDIYMSPTARFADYVIPCTVALEAADTMSIGGETIYRPAVVEPKGDAKSGWEWAFLAYKAQAELGDFEDAVVNKNAHFDYVKSTNGAYRDIQNIADEVLDAAIVNPSSRFYGMTKDELYARQYVPRANTEETKTSDPYKTDTSGQIRKNLEAYLNSAEKETTPFIWTRQNGVTNSFGAEVYSSVRASNSTVAGGIADRPNFSGKMHVYNEAAVWDYVHRLSKYHGWLPAEKRGQSNEDREGDMIVYPIPMYIAFEDCFKEAYDGFSNGKNASFFQGTGRNKPLTMSTTHDRYRVHSTHAENPLMRELNHRVVGGGWASGNDWNEYAVMPQTEIAENANVSVTPMLSSAIYNKSRATASWHEIWISTEDAAERGISDGDLCLVENPIGKVRVIARVSNRIMKGHLNLHQGSWYDPNPADGVDDGGCANTLISSHPSRYDRGNAQQFAYVKISKTGYDLR